MPSCCRASRPCPTRAFSRSISVPRYTRPPIAFNATPTVPVQAKGSPTTSPALVRPDSQYSQGRTGCCQDRPEVQTAM
jgi:hypothetical protein